MTEEANGHWWSALSPPVERLARALCPPHIPADVMVLPYEASHVLTIDRKSTLVAVADLVPLWTCYVGVARQALDAAAEQQQESASILVEPASATVTAAPLTVDDTWRIETGLYHDQRDPE